MDYRPAWFVAGAAGLIVLVILGVERLGRDAGWLGRRRLELERPPRPRLDRGEHRGRQLPAAGPLLRGRAADLPLVRRLRWRHRVERRRRRSHRHLLRHERAVRGRPRPRSSWALGLAPDRPASRRDHRSHPRLLRWWSRLDPARRRPRRGRWATALTLVSTTSYDNTWADGWPYFRIASVFGTGFLPHRATTLGLPGLVAAVLLVVTCLDRRPAGVLLAGILAALLAPFQFFAFPATYLIVGLYVVDDAEPGERGRSSATRSCSLRRSCSRRRSSSMPSRARATSARSSSSPAGPRLRCPTDPPPWPSST